MNVVVTDNIKKTTSFFQKLIAKVNTKISSTVVLNYKTQYDSD